MFLYKLNSNHSNSFSAARHLYTGRSGGCPVGTQEESYAELLKWVERTLDPGASYFDY